MCVTYRLPLSAKRKPGGVASRQASQADGLVSE